MNKHFDKHANTNQSDAKEHVHAHLSSDRQESIQGIAEIKVWFENIHCIKKNENDSKSSALPPVDTNQIRQTKQTQVRLCITNSFLSTLKDVDPYFFGHIDV